MNKNSVWLDGIIGAATGDALGLPVQFKMRDELIKSPVIEMIEDDMFRTPKGTWSDDTSMTLAILDSLIECKEVDAKDVMNRFVSWLFDSKYCALDIAIDIGTTCGISIEKYKESGNILICGKTGEMANGNGSLMRTMPLSLYYALRVLEGWFSVDFAIKGIHSVSKLTHNHPRACIACGLHFFCTKAILSGGGDLNSLLQNGIYEGFMYYNEKEEYLQDLLYYKRVLDIEEFKKAPVDDIASSGYVLDTFEAAIWGLINTHNYRDAMIKVVNLGDDTDTVGAVAGGLAGLYYGFDSIPKEWVSVLRKIDYLKNMCSKAEDTFDSSAYAREKRK